MDPDGAHSLTMRCRLLRHRSGDINGHDITDVRWHASGCSHPADNSEEDVTDPAQSLLGEDRTNVRPNQRKRASVPSWDEIMWCSKKNAD